MGFWTNRPQEKGDPHKDARFGLVGRSRSSSGENTPAAQEVWSGKQDMITRGWKIAGAAALLSGPVALGLVATGTVSSAPTEVAAPVVAQDTNAEAQAGELARQLTIAWLEAKRGDEKALAEWVDVPGSLPGDPLFRVSEPAVASIEQVPASEIYPESLASSSEQPQSRVGSSDGYSILVSAWVAESESDAPMSRRYFHVPVVFTEAGARAASVPSPVAAPAVGTKVESNYSRTADRSHPMVVSAQQFLNAMLAGSGEIGRYTSPGVVVAPIDPPIASSVEVETVSTVDDLPPASETVKDGQTSQVLITARLRNEQSPGMSAQYALTMKARAGRWEVAAVDPAPQLRSPSAAPSVETSQSSSPTTQTPASPTPTEQDTP